MNSPLDGLKVLDLSRFIAGPYCGMLLGDFGAEVVKVEKAGRGDDTRQLPPRIAGDSLYVMIFNRNKRSLSLNFRDPRGQALLRELICEADVLIENFRAGTMERMGCSWETLHALNPRLIMTRVSGFGQNGPYAERACFDVIAQAHQRADGHDGSTGRSPDRDRKLRRGLRDGAQRHRGRTYGACRASRNRARTTRRRRAPR